ncbi:MAG: EAL domain-containing protein [Pseudomonadota bacterium]
MINLKIIFIALLLFSESIFAAEVVIAVRAHSGKEAAIERWMPTVKYLQDKMPEHQITLIAVEGIKEMEQLFAVGKIDFVLTQPIAYIDLEQLYGATRILTLINKGGLTQFGSVIFTLKKQSAVHSLEDIKGKTIAGVTKKGFGGWLIARKELLDAGIDAYNDMQEVIFSGSHENVVNDVISGRADVGVVRTGIIEKMIQKRQISAQSLRIINPIKTKNFPLLHSSKLYPEWAFAKAKASSATIAADIVTYLLAMKANNPAAIKGAYEGWSIPLDYNPVHVLMRDLQIGSYENYNNFNLMAYLKEHFMLVFSLLVLFLAALIFIVVRFHQKNIMLFNLTQHLKNTQGILEASEEQTYTTLKSIGDAVISADLQCVVTYINPVAERLTGWTCSQAVGQPITSVFNIINEGTRLTVENPVERCLKEGRILGLANHTILITRDNNEVAIEDSASPINNRKGELTGAVLVFHDVTEARRLSSEISYQATHDSLTDLINRRELERRLHNSMAMAIERKLTHSFLYIDLHQFKIINDTSGHIAGDELLQKIVIVIKQSLREADTLARLGGDEFGVLLDNCALKKGTSIAQIICDDIGKFCFRWEDKRFQISASIGVVSINENSGSLATIMSHADIACYKAKEQGRNCVYSADEHIEELSQHHSQLLWLPKLRKALAEDKFRLYFQKIEPLDIKDHSFSHIEFLIRLYDDQQLFFPDTFIPIAERFKLMPDIDFWIIEHIFAYIQSQQITTSEERCIYCINLSGATISDPRLVDFILDQQYKYQIKASSICFEITETAAIANLSFASTLINKLKAKGFCFSLDDFGTGMSSFAYLKNLAVDYLKIDGTFVKEIISNPIDLAMVKSINEIGHAMQLETIAEYVESKDILDKLKSIGVDYAQGYHIHKPEPIDKL